MYAMASVCRSTFEDKKAVVNECYEGTAGCWPARHAWAKMIGRFPPGLEIRLRCQLICLSGRDGRAAGRDAMDDALKTAGNCRHFAMCKIDFLGKRGLRFGSGKTLCELLSEGR